MTARYKASTREWHVALVGILTFGAGSLTLPTAAAPSWQSPESIREAARDAARSHDSERVEAVAVDERLKLPQCSTPLATQIQRPVRRGQGVIAVSCDAPEPWRLFVPVRVTEDVGVLVARRSLQPGEVLTEADLEIRAQSSASLPYGYLGDLSQAIGLVVRRSQTAGAVLTAAALDRPPGVERGALVTLLASAGSVTVKSEGVALEPARLKERVRVRSQSGRIVEGTVESPGQVRVGL